MATGSTVAGCIDGMAAGLTGGSVLPMLTQVVGNPSGIVTVQGINGSDIAYDTEAGSIFMAGAVNTEEWIALGSVAF